jgi:hypothetical protein
VGAAAVDGWVGSRDAFGRVGEIVPVPSGDVMVVAEGEGGHHDWLFEHAFDMMAEGGPGEGKRSGTGPEVVRSVVHVRSPAGCRWGPGAREAGMPW